ncbi:MAG: aspartate ammonia-lyase [Desulfurispora sp.]|uniref:aspartate ammonia-lyase n=1 Tax=Desulfurispora sp. TaxID=3014275 RepID=UPI0040493BB8
MSDRTEWRREKDLLGELPVPARAYYGIHTVRAAENFAVSGQQVHPSLLRALAQVKAAAALANWRCGLLPEMVAMAIVQAAHEVAQGDWADQFIVDALQGGAGTSTNMNMNEVLANRAIELLGGRPGDYHLVHPLHHVNLSQSTNDTYPTALRIAAIRLVLDLSEAMAELQRALQEKEASFAGVLKLGRTEYQDALPVTLGQEFGAYAEAIARDRWRLYKVEERLRQVNLGGTAVGTGLNAPRCYIYHVIEELRRLTGLGLARAENTVDLTQNADVFAEVSGLVKAAAVNLAKISGDLMFLAAGPAGGPAEIILPVCQAGSSIMPGKVNPVIPEMVTQVAYQVMGADQVIALACAGGRLELNAFLPLVAHNLLPGLEMLARAARLLAQRCVAGIAACEQRCRQWLEASNVLVTALVPYLGYERASQVAGRAMRENKSIRQLVIEEGLLSEAQWAEITRPRELTRPGIAGAAALKNLLSRPAGTENCTGEENSHA